MELSFVGIGSAFNTKLFNTSGFLKRGKSLLLIDCGGTVFTRLQELNLIQGIESLHILITHTHPDHIGSLGDLIFYSNYKLNHIPKIFTPNKEGVENYLNSVGVDRSLYILEDSEKVTISDKDLETIEIEFIKVKHSKNMVAYGFIMKGAFETLYYSGDCNSISDYILNKLKSGEVKRIYQDTSGIEYEGSGHLSLRKLKEVIPMEFRNRVYCIHLDESLNNEILEQDGFKVGGLYK